VPGFIADTSGRSGPGAVLYMLKLGEELDLRKLEVFFWVAELKSFSQAAAHLSLRQPTVSVHIQELERALGAKVFNRIRGQVTLTALGQLLLGRARSVVALKQETVAAIEQFKGVLKGDLRVGGSNIPGEYVLPQKLGAFMNKHPEVKPVLRIGDSAGIVDDVLNGKVELGFVGFKSDDSRLAFQKMWQDEMVLAVAKAHPWTKRSTVELNDLRTQPFISRERGSGTLESLRKLLRKKRQPADKVLNVTMELGSSEAIKEALIAGLGISILSRTSIRRELDSGLLSEIPIRQLKMERDFYEVFHNRRPLSAVAQAFRSFLRSE
jgi:DNA-binding transcriptional LysR family regulator